MMTADTPKHWKVTPEQELACAKAEVIRQGTEILRLTQRVDELLEANNRYLQEARDARVGKKLLELAQYQGVEAKVAGVGEIFNLAVETIACRARMQKLEAESRSRGNEAAALEVKVASLEFDLQQARALLARHAASKQERQAHG